MFPLVVTPQDLSVFVAACGGGSSGVFLKDLDCFHRAHVNSEQRCVRGYFYAAVANMDIGQPSPWLKVACLKAQYTCPKLGLHGRECKWITTSELSKLGKLSQELSLQAETALYDCREFLKALDRTVDATSALAKLDSTMVRFIMDKQSTSIAQHLTVDSVARSFVEDFQHIAGSVMACLSLGRPIAVVQRISPDHIRAQCTTLCSVSDCAECMLVPSSGAVQHCSAQLSLQLGI